MLRVCVYLGDFIDLDRPEINVADATSLVNNQTELTFDFDWFARHLASLALPADNKPAG